MFDTLKYSRELEKTGLTAEQAEIFVRGQVQMITENVATKLDIAELKAEMHKMDAKLSLQIQKMVNRLGLLVISSFTILGVLISGLGVFLKFYG